MRLNSFRGGHVVRRRNLRPGRGLHGEVNALCFEDRGASGPTTSVADVRKYRPDRVGRRGFSLLETVQCPCETLLGEVLRCSVGRCEPTGEGVGKPQLFIFCKGEGPLTRPLSHRVCYCKECCEHCRDSGDLQGRHLSCIIMPLIQSLLPFLMTQ